MTIGEATNFARTHHDQLIEERSKILDTSQRAPVRSTGPVEAALLAHDVDADLTTLTRNGRTPTRRVTRIMKAAWTTVTDIHGVGPIIAAALLGYTGDIARSSGRISRGAGSSCT